MDIECYFERFPNEILAMILNETSEWQGIASHVNSVWRRILLVKGNVSLPIEATT